MDHFGDAVKGPASQTFLNELFIFWRELNRHISTSRYRERPALPLPSYDRRYIPDDWLPAEIQLA